jgi:hypothetical protein
MSPTQHLDPLRLYTPTEVTALLGPAVSVSWLKRTARQQPELCTRHTGRQTILFTAAQVILLHAVLTGQVGAATAAAHPPAAGGPPDAGQPVVDGGAGEIRAPQPSPAIAPRPFRSLSIRASAKDEIA